MARLILALWLLFPLAVYCGEPLNEQELREILVRLDELKLARQQIILQDRFIEAERVQHDKEAELDRRQEELSKRELGVVTAERDMWKAKAEEYKQAVDVLSKKHGGWKRGLCKVFTLGLAQCG